MSHTDSSRLVAAPNAHSNFWTSAAEKSCLGKSKDSVQKRAYGRKPRYKSRMIFESGTMATMRVSQARKLESLDRSRGRGYGISGEMVVQAESKTFVLAVMT